MTTLKTLHPSPAWPTVPVKGENSSYPVHRIFCVGRNYAEHAKEMGVEVDREAAFYFLKSALSLIPTGSIIAYPPGTSNYHYEMELVLAIGKSAFQISKEDALNVVFGYATGLDMTRRDLQLTARAKGRPWDLGKDFEQSAVISTLTRAEDYAEIGPQRIKLDVNDKTLQDAHLSDLVWSIPEIIADVSKYYHLQPGDLIYTGTPAGVGAVVPGDHIAGYIDGLDPVKLIISEAE